MPVVQLLYSTVLNAEDEVIDVCTSEVLSAHERSGRCARTVCWSVEAMEARHLGGSLQ